ncbi:MAG: hypothetical protein RL094_760 [Candidatus Parcubacteria bacterium]|jgi:hypothetical protein
MQKKPKVNLSAFIALIIAALVTLASPFAAVANSTLRVVNGTQAESSTVYGGTYHEVLRILFEKGSGPSSVNAINIGLESMPNVVDQLMVVSEEDTVTYVTDKAGGVKSYHNIRSRVVGHLNLPYQQTTTVPVGVGLAYIEVPVPSVEPVTQYARIPIENDLVFSATAQKTYVVYAHVSFNSWQYTGTNFRSWVSYLDVDENTEISWMYDAVMYGNEHRVGPNSYQYGRVVVSAQQNISPTIVSSNKPVVLGALSVEVTGTAISVTDPEFELVSNTEDPKVFAGLVDVRIVDDNNVIVQGTKPVKPQFKLSEGRVKVLFKGLTLQFDKGTTTFKFTGRFGTYDKNNPPLVSLTFRPDQMIWINSFGYWVRPNYYSEKPTVVCPPIRFVGKTPKKEG